MQEKLSLLERAARATRNWGVGVGLVAALLLPGGAVAAEAEADRQQIVHQICRNLSNMAGELWVLRRHGVDLDWTLDEFAVGESADLVAELIVDVWSQPYALSRRSVEERVLIDCLRRRL